MGKSDTVDTAPRAKRLTLSEIVEKLLTRGGAEHSSVTLTRNAKGETQIEVVVRTDVNGGIETIEQAEATARDVYRRLRGVFPRSDGTVGAAAEPEADLSEPPTLEAVPPPESPEGADDA